MLAVYSKNMRYFATLFVVRSWPLAKCSWRCTYMHTNKYVLCCVHYYTHR